MPAGCSRWGTFVGARVVGGVQIHDAPSGPNGQNPSCALRIAGSPSAALSPYSFDTQSDPTLAAPSSPSPPSPPFPF